MTENRQYDHEYKVQAVKLAKEIGQAKAAKELGVPKAKQYVFLLHLPPIKRLQNWQQDLYILLKHHIYSAKHPGYTMEYS